MPPSFHRHRDRGRWDWLSDLVQSAPPASPSAAIVDAVCRLGLRPAQIVEALAAVLEIPATRVRAPDATVAARVDGARLARLLPALTEHDHPAVRELAARWLEAPAAAYQLPRAALEAWLAGDGPCADLLAPRLRDEGLALLCPEALRRLSHSATRATVRVHAQRWLDRIDDM